MNTTSIVLFSTGFNRITGFFSSKSISHFSQDKRRVLRSCIHSSTSPWKRCLIQQLLPTALLPAQAEGSLRLATASCCGCAYSRFTSNDSLLLHSSLHSICPWFSHAQSFRIQRRAPYMLSSKVRQNALAASSWYTYKILLLYMQNRIRLLD